jgi:hypothetical protein
MLLGTKWSENVNGLNVAVINPSDKKMAADSMRKSFYSAAAVPVALGLDNRDDPEVTSMVDREIDVFVNSGFSCVVRNNVNGEVSGGAFFAYFARNEDYCVIEGASMADWHNAAAEIAMGSGQRSRSSSGENINTSTCTTLARSGWPPPEPSLPCTTPSSTWHPRPGIQAYRTC